MKKMTVLCKRIIAFVLAIVLMGSTFASASITGYAAAADGVTVDTEIIADDSEEANISGGIISPEDVSDEGTDSDKTETPESVEQITEVPSSEEDLDEVEDEDITPPSEEDEEVVEDTTTEEEITIEETTEEVVEELELLGEEVIEPMVYTGDVQDDGSTLWISSWNMQQEGMNFDDAALLEVIAANAENEYALVSIDYPDDTISAEVWNAALELLSEEDGWIKYNIKDGTTPVIEWSFCEPYEANDAIRIGCTFTIGAAGKGYTVQFDNTSFPASEPQVNVFMSNDMAGYTNFVNAPAEGDTYIVTDGAGNVLESAYVMPTEGENYYNFTLGPIDTFQAGEEYTLNMVEYTGSINTWDDGMGNMRTGLDIRPWEAGKESFTADEIIAIIKKHTGKKFNEIYIEQPDNGSNVISGKVVNTAVNYMVTGTEDNDSRLVFGFRDDEASKSTEFCLINPKSGNGTGDYAASTQMSISADTISVRIDDCPGLKTDRIDTFYIFDNGTTEAQNLVKLLGADYTKTEIPDTDTWINFESDEYSARVYVGNASSLEQDKEYAIRTYLYSGDVDTWNEGDEEFAHLSIHPWQLNKDEFSEDELLDIIAEQAKTGMKFNEIFIEGKYNEGGTISAAVANAASALLKEDAEWKSITFSYWFGDGSMDWNLVNPGTLEADVAVDASLTVPEDTFIVTKNADEAALNAERVNVSFNYPYFTDMGCYLFEAFDATGNVLGVYSGEEQVTRAYYDCIYDESIWVTVEDTSLLTNDTEYELHDLDYFGYVDEEENTLEIHFSGLLDIGQEWSPEAIAYIIESYGDRKFSEIIVGVPGHAPDEDGNLNQWPGGDPENTIVYKEIYNAAVNQLSEEFGMLTYRIYHDERIVAWQFANPSAIRNNLQMKYTLGINDYGRPVMTFNLPTLNNTCINVNINLLEGTGFTDDMINILGYEDTTYHLYPISNVIMPMGWMPVVAPGDVHYMQMSLITVNSLIKGTEYTVNPKLIGHESTEIRDEEEVRVLHINSVEYGYDTFTSALLQDYLWAWEAAIEQEAEIEAEEKANGEEYEAKYKPFNIVTIEQKSTANNVIRKADYNYIHNILVEDGYTEINFAFDSSIDECIDKENNVWDWKQCQVHWSFPYPATATADMKVNLDLIPKGVEGLKLKATKNTYPSSGVNIHFMVDNRLDIASLLEETLGEAPVEGEESKHILVLSDVAKLNKSDSEAWYWQHTYTDEGSGQERTVYNVMVDNAQKLPATECTGYPVNYGGEFYIGQENITLSMDKATAEDSPITWKSFDTNIGTFTGSKLSLINEGQFIYAATFKDLNGNQVADVYASDVTTKLLYMDFVNVPTVSGERLLTMNLNPVRDIDTLENPDDWYPRTYLDLRFFPDRAGVDLSHLKWDVSEEGIIELMLTDADEEGNQYPHGEIKALKEGTVTITVTCLDGEGNVIVDDKDQPISAKCTVEIKPSAYDEFDTEDEWNAIFDGYPMVAITDYDKTLNDIKLPSNIVWKEPTTKIADYAGAGYYEFPATYTSENGTVDIMIGVEIATINTVDVEAMLNDNWENYPDWIESMVSSGVILEDGDVLSLWPVGIDVTTFRTEIDGLNDLMEEKGSPIRFHVKADTQLTPDEEYEEEGLYNFTADKNKSGKKTFKFELVETNQTTGKSKTIKTSIFTATVAKKAIADFNDLAFGKKVREKEGLIGEKGTYYFGLPAGDNFKLTAKNLNTAVGKWGKVTYENIDPAKVEEKGITMFYGDAGAEATYYCACIEYEIIGDGTVKYSLTANDEIKSSVTNYGITYKDYLPRISTTSVTIDKNWTDDRKVVEIPLQMEEDTAFAVTTYESGSFVLTFSDEGKVCIEPKNSNKVDKGKYKVTAMVKMVTPSAAEIDYPFEITVNVTDKLPSITVKQTDKVNLFYNDSEGYGKLTVSADAEIVGIAIDGQKGAELDFDINDNGDGTYSIEKISGEGKNKKATVFVSFAGYTKTASKDISISTENKAPTLVLSQKTDTFYTGYRVEGESMSSVLTFTDKATGEAINTITSVTVKDGKLEKELPLVEADNPLQLITKNNTYYLEKEDYGIICVLDEEKIKKTTDKFTFQVKESNWTKAVKVDYSIKVDTSMPKLELVSKNVTMNKNNEIYAQQLAIIGLQLKGSARAFDDSIGYYVNVSGADAKSNQYLNSELIVDGVHSENGEIEAIRVKLNKNTMQPGNYKYNINLCADGLPTLTTQLTVKVIDTDPIKCITVSNKGSIDVLNRGRDGSSIAYTAKLKDVQGKVIGGYIEGTDAGKFESDFVDGKLVVTANEYAQFSTKQKCKITPVFIVENEEGGQYDLRGKEQSITPKQGSPKITLTGKDGNTLYRERSNELVIYADALLNKTVPVVIEHIELVGYEGTFECAYSDGIITIKQVDFDEEGHVIIPKESIDSGKSVNLKFNVYYSGKAANQKPVNATFKMVVK